jgi:hypothetical protein
MSADASSSSLLHGGGGNGTDVFGGHFGADETLLASNAMLRLSERVHCMNHFIE